MFSNLSAPEKRRLRGIITMSVMAVAAFILGRVHKTIVLGQSPEETEVYFDLGLGKAEPYNRMVSQVKEPAMV